VGISQLTRLVGASRARAGGLCLGLAIVFSGQTAATVPHLRENSFPGACFMYGASCAGRVPRSFFQSNDRHPGLGTRGHRTCDGVVIVAFGFWNPGGISASVVKLGAARQAR